MDCFAFLTVNGVLKRCPGKPPVPYIRTGQAPSVRKSSRILKRIRTVAQLGSVPETPASRGHLLRPRSARGAGAHDPHSRKKLRFRGGRSLHVYRVRADDRRFGGCYLRTGSELGQKRAVEIGSPLKNALTD